MKKALIADDTKNIRVLLTTCLEIEGYTVLSASDGRQALELLSQEAFDLIFLDIKMPEISGTEVLKQIRDRGVTTPVVVITAFATVKNAVECTKMGAVAYLQKPFTSDKVRSVLADMANAPETCPVQNASPDLATVHVLLAAGEYAEAVARLKKALSSEPDNPELYFLFGKAYEGMGNRELSDKFYKAGKLFKGVEP